MLETQQKTKQLKNVAVAIVKNEEGHILLVKTSEEEDSEAGNWTFPAGVVIPGSTYTETFASEVLEVTGCIIEAVSLVSSEKRINTGFHYEYVECKIVCKDSTFSEKSKKCSRFKWVPSDKIRTHFSKRLNGDLKDYFGL